MRQNKENMPHLANDVPLNDADLRKKQSPTKKSCHEDQYAMEKAYSNALLKQLETKVIALEEDYGLAHSHQQDQKEWSDKYFQLSGEYEALQTRLASVEEERDDAKTKVLDLRLDLDETRRLLEDSQRYVTEYNNLLADKHTLMDSNKALRLRLKDLTHELETIAVNAKQNDAVKDLQSQLAALKLKSDTEKQVFEEQIRALEAKALQTGRDLEVSKKTLQYRLYENQKLRRLLEQNEQHQEDSIQDYVSTFSLQLADSAVSTSEGKREISRLRRLLEEEKRVALELKEFAEEERRLNGQVMEDLDQKNKDLQAQMQLVQAEAHYFQESNKDLIKHVQTVERERNQTFTQLEQLRAARDVVRSKQPEELSAETEALQKENEMLKECIQEHKKKEATLKRNWQDAEQEVDQLDELIEHAQAVLSRHQEPLFQTLPEVYSLIESLARKNEQLD